MRPTFGSGSSFWPTPTASDAGYFPDLVIGRGEIALTSPFDIVAESGGQYALNTSAKVWTTLWLTLRALGWTPGSPPSGPCSPLVRLTFKHGRGSFTENLAPNPAFYELAMGWPIGWTAPGARVTGFAAWLRLARGRFSSLTTSFEPPLSDVRTAVEAPSETA